MSTVVLTSTLLQCGILTSDISGSNESGSTQIASRLQDYSEVRHDFSDVNC